MKASKQLVTHCMASKKIGMFFSGRGVCEGNLKFRAEGDQWYVRVKCPGFCSV